MAAVEVEVEGIVAEAVAEEEKEATADIAVEEVTVAEEEIAELETEMASIPRAVAPAQ